MQDDKELDRIMRPPFLLGVFILVLGILMGVSSAAPIDDMIYNGILGTVGGNPMWLGLILFGGLAVLVFVLPVQGDVKIMVLIAAAVLAGTVVDAFRPIIFLVALGILALAFLKFINR